jgi:hypothetical protein
MKIYGMAKRIHYVKKLLLQLTVSTSRRTSIFNINHHPTKIFDGFVKKGRNIIVVQKNKRV